MLAFFYFHNCVMNALFMKTNKFIALLLGCLICASLNAQNDSWDAFKKAARDIGLCVYNVNEPFYNCQEGLMERAEQITPDSLEVHYFIMKEHWAKRRTSEWAKSQGLEEDLLILFFDVGQDLELGQHEEEKLQTWQRSMPRMSNGKFFIISLENDIKFKVRNHFSDIALNFKMYHSEKPNILENIFWREFMSGRLGLLKSDIDYTGYAKEDINEKFTEFKKQFFAYKNSKKD